jgi:hypothetical protein
MSSPVLAVILSTDLPSFYLTTGLPHTSNPALNSELRSAHVLVILSRLPYFDNVGGDHLDAALASAKNLAIFAQPLEKV